MAHGLTRIARMVVFPLSVVDLPESCEDAQTGATGVLQAVFLAKSSRLGAFGKVHRPATLGRVTIARINTEKSVRICLIHGYPCPILSSLITQISCDCVNNGQTGKLASCTCLLSAYPPVEHLRCEMGLAVAVCTPPPGRWEATAYCLSFFIGHFLAWPPQCNSTTLGFHL